ncbi:MAG: PAS domain S-box protein, partial [Chloroflexota bacterium]
MRDEKKTKAQLIEELNALRQKQATQQTEEKQTLSALYKVQMEHSPDGILVVSDKGEWLSFNQRFVEMWNIPTNVVAAQSSEKAIQSVLEQLIDPDYFVKTIQAIYQQPNLEQHDDIFLKDGRIFDRYTTPLTAGTGDYYGRAWYYRDITGQKRADERFRILFEYSTDAHLIFDETGIIDCNRATIEMLHGQDKSQVLSLHPAELSPEYQPDGRRSLEKAVDMDRLAHENGYHRFEWIHQRLDGEIFPVEVTLNPITLAGKPAILTVWHDISERKEAEHLLHQRTERIELLHKVTAQGAKGLTEQIDEALSLATNLLGLDIGILSHIVDDVYTIEQFYAPDAPLYEGQTFDLG